MRFMLLLFALFMALVDRVVVVGDVHGGYNEFVTVLRQAGLIDEENRWTGGNAQLVQLGDVTDRGPDSRKVLDLIASLEGQARKAKGRVHALLGNHEVMNVLGDLRYVSPGEYEAFVTPKSESLRVKDQPLGYAEHRQAFSLEGKYGKALLRWPVALKIDDTLFVHAGISPKYARMSISMINDKAKEELSGLVSDGMLMDPDGPLWYRGMATGPEESLDGILKAFGVKRIVIGHTPTKGEVMSRFEGRVILADVGLSALYNGSITCLVIEKGEVYALTQGKRVELGK
jgi:hypothetical protein